MHELREDTFSGNKDDDAHDHIDRVLSIVGLFNIPGVTKDAIMLRVFPFTLTGAAKRWVDRLAPGTINTWDLLKKAFIQRYCPHSMTTKQLEDIHNFKQEGNESLYQAWERTMNRQLLDSQGPIPMIRPAEALTTIQTMADHSQKWHDDTTSRNIGSSSSKDGLAALVNKLDNLGRDMKKLKESVHAIQFRVGPPGYNYIINNRPAIWRKRQALEELLAKHQEESAQRSIEMEIEQLTEELRSRKEKYKQAKVVIVEHEVPSSPKKIKNLHKISFLSDSQEENTNDQLQRASVNVLPINIFEYLELTNLSETEMLVEMEEMRKKAPLGIVRDILVKIDKFLFSSTLCELFSKDTVLERRNSEWCNENSHDEKPRPRDYTFKEWVLAVRRQLSRPT
ncbi:hypothetical protein Tco_0356886 [Tanacetum coccineum]